MISNFLISMTFKNLFFLLNDDEIFFKLANKNIFFLLFSLFSPPHTSLRGNLVEHVQNSACLPLDSGHPQKSEDRNYKTNMRKHAKLRENPRKSAKTCENLRKSANLRFGRCTSGAPPEIFLNFCIFFNL